MESVGRPHKMIKHGGGEPSTGLPATLHLRNCDTTANELAGYRSLGTPIVDPSVAPDSSGVSGVFPVIRGPWNACQSAPSITPKESAGGGLFTSSSHSRTEALRRELAEVRGRESLLRTQLAQLKNELQTAAALQRDLLQSSPPEIYGGEISVLHRPADVLSGDLYSVVRLSETEIAVSLADATGHGVSAALLSASIRQLLDGSAIGGGGVCDRLQPDEVLAGVNRVLLDAQLQECQFITALYATYDEQSCVLRWARGGAPYPILVRRGGPARLTPSEGPILGVCSDARFEVVELQLDPGDTVVFHTDGLESFLLGDSREPGCCVLNGTAWFETLGEQPLRRQLRQLEAQLATLTPDDPRADDTTIVALHVHDAASHRPECSDAQASHALALA